MLRYDKFTFNCFTTLAENAKDSLGRPKEHQNSVRSRLLNDANRSRRSFKKYTRGEVWQIADVPLGF